MFEDDPILGELPWIEANDKGGHVITMRRHDSKPCQIYFGLGRVATAKALVRMMFYGSSQKTDEFSGFSDLYSAIDPKRAQNAVNIIDARGAGGASIWLVCWGKHSVHMAYKAEDEMLAGLVVNDWRYAVRIANIDVERETNIVCLMARAYLYVPTFMEAPRFYMGSAARRLFAKEIGAEYIDKFKGIPIVHVAALHNREQRARMIPRDAEPIGHKPPLPRIGINDPAPTEAADPNAAMRDEMWRFQRQVEADRIWGFVKSAAEGSNIGAAAEDNG